VGYGKSNTRYFLATLLLWGLPLFGQLEVGSDTSMSLSGNLSMGYDGGFQETGVSSHGLALGGDGFLSGYYYDRRFLSFDAHPYYNRSQANSTYQSLSNSSGFTADANFFSGSHFPGSVYFSKNYSTTGTFGIPGVAGFNTNGDGQSFSVNWSELLPQMPTLFASYSMNNSTNTIYGLAGDNQSANRTFDLHSDYRLLGFGLRGFFQHQNTHSSFPSFFSNEQKIDLSTDSNSYGFSADHALPLHGQAYGGWRRTSAGYDAASGHTDASTDTSEIQAQFHPTERFTFGGGLDHTSNLSAVLEQQVVNAGGLPSDLRSEFGAGSTRYNATAGYVPLTGLFVQGQVVRLSQRIGDRDFSNTLYGATATYNKLTHFLGGFTLVVGVYDISNQDGHEATSFITNLTYSKRINGWDLSGHFDYSQQLQTLIATYNTSNYGYGASVRKRFGYRTYWTATFNGGHSGLSQFEGYTNRDESYSTSLTYRGYAFNASYAQSSGASLLTAGGLVQSPLPGPVLDNQILFNGTGWTFGASGSPFRKMQLSGTFSRNLTGTFFPEGQRNSFNNVLNMQLRYPIRKLFFTAGYTNFRQQFSTTGSIPTNLTTYYFGLSRWFNIF
jgi:hypothetical protein